MKIWLDDQFEERKGWFKPIGWRRWFQWLGVGTGWIYCRWPTEVIEKLKAGGVEEISLDHDLGDEETARLEDRREITGYDVMLWIEEQVITNGYQPPNIVFHTKNSVGMGRMERSRDAINKFLNS